MSAGHSDFRNSIRFPLHLEVKLKTPTGEFHARTTDISAGGISFQMEASLEVGSSVEFTIEMPIDGLAATQPVLVNCVGRVVRCTEEESSRNVAVVIDEYHFQRL